MKKILFVLAGIVIATAATAKLPPLSDEAKVKAAETKAKAEHGTKVAAYQLCLSQDKVAAKFADKSKAVAPGPCVNPGLFEPEIAVVPAAVAPAPAPAAVAPAAGTPAVATPVVAVKK
jgi:hypothetical protein